MKSADHHRVYFWNPVIIRRGSSKGFPEPSLRKNTTKFRLKNIGIPWQRMLAVVTAVS